MYIYKKKLNPDINLKFDSLRECYKIESDSSKKTSARHMTHFFYSLQIHSDYFNNSQYIIIFPIISIAEMARKYIYNKAIITINYRTCQRKVKECQT